MPRLFFAHFLPYSPGYTRFTRPPGSGMLRTAILFGALYLLLGRYDADFRAVAHDQPFNPNVIGGIFAAWLFAILAAMLVALSYGIDFPTGRGVHRPLAVVTMMLPLIGAVAFRFWQIYIRFGQTRA